MDKQVLWQGYAHESKAYIEDIEAFFTRIQKDIQEKGHYKGDVTVVFRSFHSLKGGSFGMGLEGIAELAHACEDILGLVRDHGASINTEVSDHILSAVEHLAQNIEIAVEKQEDIPVSPKILQQIKADYASMKERGGVYSPESSRHKVNEEGELMGVFCETVRDTLGQIYKTLSDADASDDERNIMKENLNLLRDGASMLELEELVLSFQSLASLQEKQDEATIYVQNELLPQLEILFEIAEVEPIILHADQDFTQYIQDIKVDLTKTVSELIADKNAPRNHDIAKKYFLKVSEKLPDLAKYLEKIQHLALKKQINISSDIILRYCHGQLKLEVGNGIFLKQIISILDLVVQGVQPDDEQYRTSLADIEALISFSIKQDETLDENIDIVDTYDIDEIYRSVLTNAQIKEIVEKTQSGYFLYGLEAYPDRNRELGSKLLEWLKTSVNLISNKTVFNDLETGFEFLILSKAKVETLEKDIQQLDANSKIIASVTAYHAEEAAQIYPFGNEIVEGGNKTKTLRVAFERVDEINDLVQSVTRHLDLIEEAMEYLDTLDISKINLKKKSVTSSDVEEQKFRVYAEAIERGKFCQNVINDANSAVKRINSISEICSNIRLVPLDQMLNRIPRSARFLADELGKKISININSVQLDIDYSTYEILSETLIHLVRNAVDHGLETAQERIASGKSDVGTLDIFVKTLGEEILLEISDTGRGINHAKIAKKALASGVMTREQLLEMTQEEIVQLIMLPNFTTAKSVSQVSGRGVGLDVVHSNLVYLGGNISIKTKVGKGTTFVLRLPLQSTKQRVLLFEVGSILFAAPEIFINKIVTNKKANKTWKHQTYTLVEDEYLPVTSLHQLFNLEAQTNSQKQNEQIAIVTQAFGLTGAFLVDRIVGVREIFLQKGNDFFRNLPYIQRAAVIGMNEVPLILDIYSILVRGKS